MDSNMESYCPYNINGPNRWFRLTNPFRRMWVYCANHGKPNAPPPSYPRHAPKAGPMRAPSFFWQKKRSLVSRHDEEPIPPRRQPSQTDLENQEMQAFLEYQRASPSIAQVSSELGKAHLYCPQANCSSFERSDKDGWGSLEQTVHEVKHPPRSKTFFVRFDRLNRVTLADKEVEIKTAPPSPPESSEDEAPDEICKPNGLLRLIDRIKLLERPPPSKPERKKETEDYLSTIVRQYEIPRGPRSRLAKYLRKMRPGSQTEGSRVPIYKKPQRSSGEGTVMQSHVPISERPRVPTPDFAKQDRQGVAGTVGKRQPPQLKQTCSPKAILKNSGRSGWTGKEEKGQVGQLERSRTPSYILRRPDRCDWACTEKRVPDPEASNPNCGRPQEHVKRTCKEESKAKKDVIKTQSKTKSKKQRRLRRKRQNKIFPAAKETVAPIEVEVPATQDDSEESLVEIDLKTLKARCNRENIQREVSIEQRKSRPTADTRIIQVMPACKWSREHKKRTPAGRALPRVPKEVSRGCDPVCRPLLKPQSTYRPLPLCPSTASTTSSSYRPTHQQTQQTDRHIVELGRVEQIPQSVTGSARQLSCRVFKPEDFEEVNRNGGKVRLGKGTFGNVALKRMRRSDRPLVAVKSFMNFVEETEIFQEVEAMQVAQGHWAFPKFHGIIRNGKYSSIVLDFIGDSTSLMGQTVFNAIQQNKHMKFLNNWIWIASDITQGLNYLHNKGFLHCDLKSNNALLRHDGNIWRAKIIDMGKACRKEEASGPLGFSEEQKQENLKRFPHIPHEVVTGREGYTVAGDIYSLGCLFLQIANVSPRKGEMIQLGQRCYEEDPKLRPALPRVIEALSSMARSPWKPKQHRQVN